MKLIDKKGKLFGVINVIDLAIIVIVIIMGVGIFKFQDIKSVINNFNSSEKGDVYITYSINGVKMVSYEGIVVGDTFFEEDTKQIVGEVLEKSYENSKIATTNSEGKFIYSEVPDRYDVIFKVKASGTYDDMKIVVNGKDIHIGEKVEINSRISNFTAIIYNIELE